MKEFSMALQSLCILLINRNLPKNVLKRCIAFFI